MPKVRGLKGYTDKIEGYVFYCPGCKENHLYTLDRWTFNGNMERPTFTPSLLYPSKAIRCHLYVTDGKIQYCNDCGHDLANKTIDMIEWEDRYL